MFRYLLQGLVLGLAYVAPIGTQNLYVINTALKRKGIEVFQTAFITFVFDISLAVACFFGIGVLLDNIPMLKLLILLFGGIAVIFTGAGMIKSRIGLDNREDVNNSLIKLISTCFAVTWLNPQAIIDGSLLLGGFKAALSHEASTYFIIGVCSASFLWFHMLAALVLKLNNKFNMGVVRAINIICGITIMFYGFKLAYSFIQLVI